MSLLVLGFEPPKYKGEHKDFDRYGCDLTVYKNGKIKLRINATDTEYFAIGVTTPIDKAIDDLTESLLSGNSHEEPKGIIAYADEKEAEAVLKAREVNKRSDKT